MLNDSAPPEPAAADSAPSGPQPNTDTLKLNFDMTKQVMSTTAIVIPLLLLFMKGDPAGVAHPPLLAKLAAIALFVSLIVGMISMGRLIANAEEGRTAALEPAARWIAMLQHFAFLVGMGLLAWLVLCA